MGRKILNVVVTLLAWLGVFVIIGAVGKVDYVAELGLDYPIYKTLLTVFVGFVMCVPAIIRGLFCG